MNRFVLFDVIIHLDNFFGFFLCTFSGRLTSVQNTNNVFFFVLLRLFNHLTCAFYIRVPNTEKYV